MNNPFSLLFGKPPIEAIERRPQQDRIISEFTSETPVNQIDMISGIRGSGKTVFMTEVSNQLKNRKDWIVIALNSERDLLHSFAAKLCSESSLAKQIRLEKIDLSFLGLGIRIGDACPVIDVEDAIIKMLTVAKKKGKRILVTIDEVTNTKTMREFVSAYQIMLREDLPVFILMTGLYKNISSIRNADPVTFLERAPRIELEPLEKTMIADRYMAVFDISQEKAVKMAQWTRGYSFAFQVLGYYMWEDPGDLNKAIKRSKQYLKEYAYKKIWSELSKKDREVLVACAMIPTGEICEIREILRVSSDQFNPYRDRLIKAGVLSGRQRGVLTFELPGFDEFVVNQDRI